MIRLIILFVTIKLTMHCEENIFTTKGPLHQVLYEVASKFNDVSKFPWQICGKSVPTSKYLPIRAGTSTGNTRFEVLSLSMFEAIKREDRSKYEIQNYKILFYVYVTGQSTVFKFSVLVSYTKKIYIQLNRNEIKSTDVDKSACLTKSKDGCKFRIDKLKSVIKLKKQSALSISMLNGWNQVGFINIAWKTHYSFYIHDQNSIIHRSFIPWNIILPNACAKRDQYVSKHLDKVNHFELDMRFTYGQMDGLNTVISCFREIASENTLNVKIDGTYTKKYKIAKFEVHGERNAMNEFYKLLVDRKKSAKCIEYICIDWNTNISNNMNRPVYDNTVPIYSNNAPTYRIDVPIYNMTDPFASIIYNSKCTNRAIGMKYPQSIDMIEVELATTNAQSYAHLTTCIRNILGDRYKLIRINKINDSKGTAAIYIKPGDTAATIVKKGMRNCYTSIRSICRNKKILRKLRKQRRARKFRIILIVVLSALVPIALLIVHLIKRPALQKNETKPVGTRNDIDASIHRALFGHLENKGHMNSNTYTKNTHSHSNVNELMSMDAASVRKDT